ANPQARLRPAPRRRLATVPAPVRRVPPQPVPLHRAARRLSPQAGNAPATARGLLRAAMQRAREVPEAAVAPLAVAPPLRLAAALPRLAPQRQVPMEQVPARPVLPRRAGKMQ